MMSKPLNQEISLDDLWKSASIDNAVFQPELLTDIPPVARRYLEYAIAPNTQLASAVRFWIHGDIKLGEKWHPFKGEEVIYWNRGMIWRAMTWAKGLPIWGGARIFTIYGGFLIVGLLLLVIRLLS